MRTTPLGCLAAGVHAPLDVPFWAVLPFALLLLAIAVLPAVMPHFWHRDRNKVIVTALLALPVAGWLLAVGPASHWESLARLGHAVGEYASFLILLTALYTIAGGIVVRGDLPGTPFNNTLLLAVGAVLANLIGTTGASMLLIRPALRINQDRKYAGHVPVFFIFIVSNLGGLLTPLGDPPLFLGFLRGVPFTWTLTLWPHWLLTNGLVLAVFYFRDRRAWAREEAAVRAVRLARPAIRLEGWVIGVPLLVGVVVAILLRLPAPWTEIILLALTGTSVWRTPRALREANGFLWAPVLEVAILFAGIFVTMVPALAMLEERGKGLGVTEPWQFFWLTGMLSACLDNAPTYVTFATLAAGGGDFGGLVGGPGEVLLRAVSCGAVFMGAMTYIGNGPNFMVKAIAEQAGWRMPSFFGYMANTGSVLLPVFVVVTVVFFRG